MTDVVVVGSGPGGLAAAVTCARAGLDVLVLEAEPEPGGGMRTENVEGLDVDVCSAVHPLALASPFFRAFDLAARGVELALPEASFAHPLDHEDAVIAWHDLERTAAELETPGWLRTFAPLVARADAVVELAMSDHRELPLAMPDGAEGEERMAIRAMLAPTLALARGMVGALASRRWGPRADALFSGVAAHATSSPRSLAWSAGGLLLATLAHSAGWPVPVGGSRAIADALLADLAAHGGRVETGRGVHSLADLPAAKAFLWDTSPAKVAQVYGSRLGAREGVLGRTGPGKIGAATVELTIDGEIPWADPRVARAGTVHLGGSGPRVRRAERIAAAGFNPRRPYVLLVDPAAAVPGRVVGGKRHIGAYAHVPVGSGLDPAEAVLEQIERFAPDARDVVVDVRSTPASELSRHNANLVGGDIAGGAFGLLGLVSRPTVLRDPYVTGAPGVYLCSSSVPPGPGVHGMTGWHAARRALGDVFHLPPPPLHPTPTPHPPK